MSGSWTKGSDQFFLCETWSVNYERYWKIAIWSCRDTLYLRIMAEKMFLMKIHEEISWENSKPSWRYLIFSSREEDAHVHSFPIYGCSIKWRKTINEMSGNIPGGSFLGGKFPRENFPGGILMGRNFSCGNFPEGNFPRTEKIIASLQKLRKKKQKKISLKVGSLIKWI